MPEYQLSVTLRDGYGRIARKQYFSQVLTNFVEASNAAASLVSALEDITGMGVQYYSLSETTVVAGTPTPGANRDAGITLSVLKSDSQRATLKVPAPVTGYLNIDGTVDLTDADIVTYFEHFTSAGDWTISDGELAVSLIGGTLDK